MADAKRGLVSFKDAEKEVKTKRDAFAKIQSSANKVLQEMQDDVGGRQAFEEEIAKARYHTIPQS